MRVRCPNCRVMCTVSETESASCPSCGCQLQTESGGIGLETDVLDRSEGATTDWPAPLASVERLEEDEPRFPFRLGRYRFERLLGTGGFARVFLATDEELMRPLAIKVPLREKASPDRARAFVSEGRLAARVRHPNIVTIFDVGLLEDRTPFLAMEYVAGSSFALILAQRLFELREAVEILAKVAEAVHAAHQRGLVHRDLKPSNILLDESREPKVVDFGLAVHESSQSGRKGEFAGTVPYMSPEQIREEVDHLDGRTDIWSLGIILYQVLTHRRPFSGEHLEDEILAREAKPPRQIDQQIPKKLETVCLKCLSKPVTGRYNTAQDLAEALQDWLDHPEDGAGRSLLPAAGFATAVDQSHAEETPPPTAPIAGALAGRRPVVGRGLAILAPLLVLGVALGLFSWRRLLSNSDLLDRSAKPGIWCSLLVAPPTPVSWHDQSGDYKYDPKRQSLAVQSQSTAIFTIGRTSAKSYRFQCTVSPTAWPGGTFGIFWGWHPTTTVDGYEGHRCEAILVIQLPPDSGGGYRMHREVWDVLPVEGSTLSQLRRTTAAAIVIPPPPDDCVLELRVENGNLMDVRWKGESEPRLAAGFDPGIDVTGQKFTELGLIGEIGAFRFHDARFLLPLEKDNP